MCVFILDVCIDRRQRNMESALGAVIVVSLKGDDRDARLIIAMGACDYCFTSGHTQYPSFNQLIINELPDWRCTKPENWLSRLRFSRQDRKDAMPES